MCKLTLAYVRCRSSVFPKKNLDRPRGSCNPAPVDEAPRRSDRPNFVVAQRIQGPELATIKEQGDLRHGNKTAEAHVVALTEFGEQFEVSHV